MGLARIGTVPGVSVLAPLAVPEAEDLADLAAYAERVVGIEEPLEAERVQVVLADLHKARLDLDKALVDVELVQCVLEVDEVVARVLDAQLAERLQVEDGAALRPVHAHHAEELLPVALLVLLAVVLAAGVLAAERACGLHRADFARRVVHLGEEGRKHWIAARHHLVDGHALVHDDHDGALHPELVAHGVAD